jgi:5-methylcytosine-specific restriction protein A
MVSRKDEILDIAPLVIGASYSKREIAELGKISLPESPYDFGGFTALKNTVLIFINLERKEPLPHQSRIFQNQIDGDMVYTDSQPTNTRKTSIIQRIAQNGEDVRLFARLAPKINSKVQPFVYCGRISCLDQFGNGPVRLHWQLNDYQELKNHPNFIGLITSENKSSKLKNPLKSAIINKSYTEGAKKTVFTNRYERDITARYSCIQYYGAQCWVCDFDFERTYGSLGAEYIVVHHRVPVAVRSLGGKYELDPQRDLVPLCANCHAMVHRTTPARETLPGALDPYKWEKLIELRETALLDSWERLE